MKMTPQLWAALAPAEQERLVSLKAQLASRNMREASRLVLERGRKYQEKDCSRCHVSFVPTGGKQEFCSPTCRKPPKGSPHKVAPGYGEMRRQMWAEGRVKFKPRVCVVCDTEFVPRSGQQRYCSTSCWGRAHKLRSYGLTPQEFRALMESQGGVCALCGVKQKGWNVGSGLVVDHCHKTGKIRGLLCGNCNTAIGRFGDDPVRLRAAAEYIDRC